jgi:hypothetical protein
LEGAQVVSDCVNGARLPRRRLERRSTRDERVPLSDDDREMENGWRCIPVPPTDDSDWFIVDELHDRRTVWGRWRDSDEEAA